MLSNATLGPSKIKRPPEIKMTLKMKMTPNMKTTPKIKTRFLEPPPPFLIRIGVKKIITNRLVL